MNLLSWLDALSTPPTEAATARRTVLTQLGRAAASLTPLAALSTPAVAGPRPTSVTTDALNAVLRVLNAQTTLLNTGLTSTTLTLPGTARATIQKLRDQAVEMAGVLRTAIERSAEVAVSPVNYDFTGSRSAAQNGPIAALTNYDHFLQVAQALADLLVRTLIGQLSVVLGLGSFIDILAQLQGTAARSAALIRRRRQQRGALQGPWVTGTDLGDLNPLLAPIYVGDVIAKVVGEDNVTQYAGSSPSGLNLTTTAGLSGRAASVYTEAFDEPLTAEQSKAALDLFTY